MVTVIDAITPYRLLKEENDSSSSAESSPVDAVLFVGISLVLGIASRHLLRGTRVPYTVALLVIGIALGSLEYGTNHSLGKIGNGIRIWNGIDPELLLAVFLPALLFESSFAMEVHQIKRCLGQMVLLAGPGVLISTFCLAYLVSYFAYYTAQEWAEASGVLTVMTLGMFYAAFARTAFKGDSQKSLHHFWEMVAYIANTLIFILSGVVIAEGVLDSDKIAYQGAISC